MQLVKEDIKKALHDTTHIISVYIFRGCAVFQHFFQVEEDTSHSMRTLMELDRMKNRVEQTADALQVTLKTDNLFG